MRKTVEDRITTLHRKTIVRPTIEVLGALVGPHARACWDQLGAQGEWQRLNAVLRFLFAAVIIDNTGASPAPLTTAASTSNLSRRRSCAHSGCCCGARRHPRLGI